MLINLLAEGNEAAFRELYLSYFDRIYSAALAYLKVHEQAEDITQQVFLKIWEKRHSLVKVENVENYLFIIARNAIFNQFSRLATQRKNIQYVRELFEEELVNSEEMMIRKQERAILEKAVNQLPTRQQEAYRLSREKGLSYEEIAQVMNISKPTVREYIVNSRHFIRECLLQYKDQLISLLLYVAFFKNIF
ncbi:hypothetical protein A3860_12565 [Niastella vici]|uniref:HTH luxR-type domain-containing protein n=1 Tax=Niastella vici TaxID=1703345 RepID=A0A1V9G6X9_9BACT|nr:RNA polymerase sigma-70 factor [Niastella vici]OQP66330.1 hypothetical protein A3860_12565 [Niastella vici]